VVDGFSLRWSETFDLILEPISVIATICELPSKVVLLLTHSPGKILWL
jgi:hypothetical protein